MNEDLRHAIHMIGIGLAIGFSLIVYAHANFASKSVVEKMDDRIYEIHKVVVKQQEIPWK